MGEKIGDGIDHHNVDQPSQANEDNSPFQYLFRLIGAELPNAVDDRADQIGNGGDLQNHDVSCRIGRENFAKIAEKKAKKDPQDRGDRHLPCQRYLKKTHRESLELHSAQIIMETILHNLSNGK